MAIIVEQHVVADQYEVGDTTITAGMAVQLDSDGKAERNTDAANLCIGLAGDSKLTTEGQTTAYGAQVYIGVQDPSPDATHNTRWTANRVSDFYNETLASGKITVYNGGGKFWISEDIWDSTSVTVGQVVLPSSTAGKLQAGSWSDGKVIGKIVGIAQKVASGVPGTDIDGSMSLNAGTYNEWIPIILSV